MKKRTGPRSFMDLVPVRESGVPVRRKTDRYSQTVITFKEIERHKEALHGGDEVLAD